MIGKRKLEGYLLIDNRNGPGVSEEFIRASGKDAPVVGEGEVYESATITCSHCQTQVILNPDRTRERSYCRKCDHYICDQCAVVQYANGGKCTSFKQVLDLAEKQLPVLQAQQPDGTNNTIEMLRRSILHG